MVLGSHNSWSYLTPTKWWMKLIRFTAKCQSVDIKTQYEKYGVRCFDLRVNWTEGHMDVVHGFIHYKISEKELDEQRIFLNSKKDCYVRVILDIRNKKDYNTYETRSFSCFCQYLIRVYKDIKFWCCEDLFVHCTHYDFISNPTCDEFYSSVRNPKKIDDWIPWLYAKLNNKKVIEKGTDKDILMIDFVNIK